MIFADVTKTERWHVRSCPISEAAEPKVCIGGAVLTALSSTTHLRSGRPQNRGRVRGESDLLTCSVNQFRGPYDSFQEEFFPLLFLRQRTPQDVHRSPSFGSIFPTETEGGRTLELLSPR